jgi:hypothetical protein
MSLRGEHGQDVGRFKEELRDFEREIIDHVHFEFDQPTASAGRRNCVSDASGAAAVRHASSVARRRKATGVVQYRHRTKANMAIGFSRLYPDYYLRIWTIQYHSDSSALRLCRLDCLNRPSGAFVDDVVCAHQLK